MNDWFPHNFEPGEVGEGYIINTDENIGLAAIWSTYRDWQRENYPNIASPDRPSIIQYFSKVWGPMSKKQTWAGWRLKRRSDDDSGGVDDGLPGM